MNSNHRHDRQGSNIINFTNPDIISLDGIQPPFLNRSWFWNHLELRFIRLIGSAYLTEATDDAAALTLAVANAA